MSPSRSSVWQSMGNATLAAWLVLAPLALAVVALWLVGYLAMRPWWGAAGGADLGRESLREVLSDAARSWRSTVGNTLLVTGVSSGTGCVLGVPLALLLFRTDLPGRRGLVAVLLLLACLPVYAGATAILSTLGVNAWSGSALGAALVHAWLGLPWAILILGLGYRTIDGRLEEAAALEASWRRVGLRFDLPLLAWSLMAVVAVQCWIAGTDISVTDLLGVPTLAQEVYASFQLSRSAYAQSIVVLPYVVLFGVLIVGVAGFARSVTGGQERGGERPPATLLLGRWRWPLCAAVTLLFAGLVGIPVYQLLGQIGGYRAFADSAANLRPEMSGSLTLVLCVGSIVLIWTMGTVWLTVSRRRLGGCVRVALALLLAVPTPCLAIGLIEMLNRPGALDWIGGSGLLLVLGQVLRWMPVAVLLAAPGAARVSADLVDAARLDGCRTPQLHWHLIWPLAVRYFALSTVAVMVLVFGELTASVLLSPPGVLTLSVRFFTLAHYSLAGQAAAICVITWICMVIPWGVLLFLLRRPE